MNKTWKRAFTLILTLLCIGTVAFTTVYAAGTLTRSGTAAIINYGEVGVEIETDGFENNLQVTGAKEETYEFHSNFWYKEGEEPDGYYNRLNVNTEMTMRTGDSVTVRVYSEALKDYWEWHASSAEENEQFRCYLSVDWWRYSTERNMWIPEYGHSEYGPEYAEYTFKAEEGMDKITVLMYADYEMRVELTIYIGDYAVSQGYDLPGNSPSGGSSGGSSSGSPGSSSSSGSSGGSRILQTIPKVIGGIAVTFVVVKLAGGVVKIFKKSVNQEDVRRVKKEKEKEKAAQKKAEEAERKKREEEEKQRQKDRDWTHKQAQKLSPRDTAFDREVRKQEKKYQEGLKKLEKEAKWNQVGLKYNVVGDLDAIKKAVAKDMEKNAYTSKLMIEKANAYDTAVTVAEGIVTVADVSVSALSNVTGPLGPVINDMYTVGKNFGSRLSEARYGNGDYSTAFWQAAAESLIDVAQNHANITEGSLSSMAKDIGFNVAANVGGEGFKAGLNSYIEGKDWPEILVDTGSAMGQGAVNSFVDMSGSLGNTFTNDAVASRQRAIYDKSKRALEIGQKNGLKGKTLNKQHELVARRFIDGVQKGQKISDASWDVIKSTAKKSTNAVREEITDKVKSKLF